MRGEPIAVILVGDGSRRRLRGGCANWAWPTSRCSMPSRRPRSRRCCGRIDIAIIGWRDCRSTVSASPNKLMDYMMGLRGAAFRGGGQRPGRRGRLRADRCARVPASGAGRPAPPGGPGAGGSAGDGRSGRAYVVETRAYPVLAQRFIEAVSCARRIRGHRGMRYARPHRCPALYSMLRPT